jgi:hypothetical protein
MIEVLRQKGLQVLEALEKSVHAVVYTQQNYRVGAAIRADVVISYLDLLESESNLALGP